VTEGVSSWCARPIREFGLQKAADVLDSEGVILINGFLIALPRILSQSATGDGRRIRRVGGLFVSSSIFRIIRRRLGGLRGQSRRFSVELRVNAHSGLYQDALFPIEKVCD
jgi:hypothetical protein